MRALLVVTLSFAVLALVISATIWHFRTWFWPRRCIPVFSNTDASAVQTPPPVVPVWMFWNTTPLPEAVQLCWNNWCYWCARSEHRFVPTLVTDANVAQFVDVTSHPCFDAALCFGPEIRSDFIRLALLSCHGGIYLDATVIMTEPLDWVLGKDKRGFGFFQAMFNPKNMNLGCDIPVIETSFLSAPPNHPFVAAWFERLLQLEGCSATSLRRMVRHTPKQANLTNTYHFTYHALTQLLLETPLTEHGAYNLYDGLQLKYMNYHHQSVAKLALQPRSDAEYGPLLKLIGRERRELTRLLLEDRVVPGSFVDVFLVRMPPATS